MWTDIMWYNLSPFQSTIFHLILFIEQKYNYKSIIWLPANHSARCHFLPLLLNIMMHSIKLVRAVDDRHNTAIANTTSKRCVFKYTFAWLQAERTTSSLPPCCRKIGRALNHKAVRPYKLGSLSLVAVSLVCGETLGASSKLVTSLSSLPLRLSLMVARLCCRSLVTAR